MEWSDLRIFLAIARAGTLGGAARVLGQTQPTMGRRLRALEAALGHTLFQRTSAGFLLTNEGSALRSHAERMEAEALGIERVLAGQAQSLSGELRVTSSEWFGSHVLTPVLGEFAALHPQVTVELLTDARMLSLSRREADIAFRIRPFVEPDVVSRKLMHVAYGVYVRAGDTSPLGEEGDGATLIALNADFAGIPDDSWLQQRLPRARTVFRTNSRDVQARICREGAGIAVLPVPLGDHAAGLERLHLGSEPPGRDTWVGYHRDLRWSARLRTFLDLVITRLAD